ncbi:MAG: flagellar motor switch protein [Methanomassiliicoccales archaeon PtaU1.Bin124]|nr:MAG: flagellar motor switch protein [Methanomassiliicoccales archaeon PtaU1.Bin124]
MVEFQTEEGEQSFQEIEIDALREAGNIGASHASTAMSSLVRAPVMIDVPDCIVCKTEQMPEKLGAWEQQTVATLFQTYGRGTGVFLMLMSYDTAIRLSSRMLEHMGPMPTELDEESLGAISEMGNICTSAYLNAMAQFLGTTVLPSPPMVAIDMLSAILQYPASLVAQVSDLVVVLKTSFQIENEIYQGCFVFLPDPESQTMLLEKFGAL